jgi:sugar phosphate isomerase/epimerase
MLTKGYSCAEAGRKKETEMKLGFITSILEDFTYEEMIDFASEHGFECVEVASWKKEKAERRYAGVSHIDAERVLGDDSYAAHISGYAKEKNVEISALAYYPNVMDADRNKGEAAVEHLKNVILASAKLNVNMVTTFIGRDQTKTVEENLLLVKKVWEPVIRLAEENGVKIAIENCPMLFGPDQWPGGQNLMTTPAVWRKVFEILDSDCLGINYDPSHFVWQMIDPIRPIYEFKDKISSCIRNVSMTAALWLILLISCLRRSPDLEMWTGADMYLLLQTSVTMVIHALRSRTRRLKVQGK